MFVKERSTLENIDMDTAAVLCGKIRQQNSGRWYTFNGLWCLVCAAQAKGDLAKMCFNHPPDNRGCVQINKRYDKNSETKLEE